MVLPHWSAIISILVIIIARIKTIIGWCGTKWTALKPILTPVILKAEELAHDGVIDKADRKILVTTAINTLQQQGTIKLNLLEKWIVNMVIDYMARRLPDFKVTEDMEKVINEIADEVRKGA